MREDELRDGGALLGTSLAEVAELSRDVHRAVADRVFSLLGPPARPVRLLHDAIAATAYGATRWGVATVPAVAAAAAASTVRQRTDAVTDTPTGHAVRAALNGFWGDRLAAARPSLAPGLRLRTEHGPLRSRPANVVHDAATDATHPPTGRIVLFVHGLCENDRFWSLGAEHGLGDRHATYGSRLRDSDGWTPLYADLNTGLRISANGALLADALDAVVGGWPVPVTAIAIVGHSMGGLVARSAAHQAHDRGDPWVARLGHVVGLGVPHLGAPLERWVNAGTAVLAAVPETRPFATWLNRRSVGIKDLRFGALLESDWDGADPDERLVDRCGEVPLLPHVAYSMVSATLSRRPDGPLAHDLLVGHTSAHGTRGHRRSRDRRIAFEAERLAHLGGRHHFTLLADPAVLALLQDWLAGPAHADAGR